MTGLILKLRPYEELMINGVIVENGDHKTKLRVKTEGAHILRLRDAITPEQATTPLKRACYLAQQAVGGRLEHRRAATLIWEALESHRGGDEATMRRELSRFISDRDFYRAMRFLGELAAREKDGEAPTARRRVGGG